MTKLKWEKDRAYGTAFIQESTYTNPLPRFVHAMKVGLGVGAYFGWNYCMSKQFTINNPKATKTMLYFTFPLVGLGFFYAGGTFIAGHIRKKDDELNHVIGVLTTTPLVRKFLSFRITFVVIAYSALILAGMKHIYMNNKKLGLDYNKDVEIATTGFDVAIWSQQKPAGSDYLKYNLV